MNIKPYYDPAKLDLEMISFECQPGRDFDIIAFWATKSGLIFTASDSGCSCSTPFGQYMGETQGGVIQQLERVRNVSHVLSIFKLWNNEYENTKVPASDRMRLADWVNSHINNRSDVKSVSKPVVEASVVKPKPVDINKSCTIELTDNMVVPSTIADVLDDVNLNFTVDGEDVTNQDINDLFGDVS